MDERDIQTAQSTAGQYKELTSTAMQIAITRLEVRVNDLERREIILRAEFNHHSHVDRKVMIPIVGH